MNHQEIKKIVTKIVSRKLKISMDEIIPDSTLKDLGADSLDELEVIIELEEIFGITFSDDIQSEDLNPMSLCRYFEKNT